MPPLTLLLWAASVILNGFAALTLIPKSRHFPAFWLFMVASLLRSLWLLSAIDSHDRYVWISSSTAPYLIGIEALAVVYAFWSITENFPRWHFAGSVFLAGMAILGASSAWLLRAVGVPVDWAGTWQAAYLWQRHWMLALAVTMMLMRCMVKAFSSELLPVRPITQRAADCLAISIALGAITAQAVMLAGTPIPTWARCVGPIAGCINGLLWSAWLPQAETQCAGPEPSVRRYLMMMHGNRAAERLLRGTIQG